MDFSNRIDTQRLAAALSFAGCQKDPLPTPTPKKEKQIESFEFSIDLKEDLK